MRSWVATVLLGGEAEPARSSELWKHKPKAHDMCIGKEKHRKRKALKSLGNGLLQWAMNHPGKEELRSGMAGNGSVASGAQELAPLARADTRGPKASLQA